MAQDGKVVIKIDGDDSGYQKTLNSITSKTKAGIADIKAGIDMATAAARKLFGVAQSGVNYNAAIEQLKTSFEVMTGSAEKAAEVVDRLRVMGAETPFEMKDLASTTQLLMQYGFTADEALDRMKMLGDVAQGNVNAMNSIALGYAQMSSAGKVNLVDIKQMINGGFNPLQEISERTGESMASLYDRISDGAMTVDEITESMRHATSGGGRFFQSMEKQSQTLNGQLSTLKDNADQLLGSLTEGVSEGLRDQILPFANNLVAELQAAFDAGGYQGLVDTATNMIPDLLGMMTGKLQDGISGLTRWLPKGATQLMQALPGALRAAGTVTPQLTQALFEVAGSVLGELVSMTPELAPALRDGILDTFSAALNGAFDVIGNVYTGIERAMHQGQTQIAGMWVDNEAIAKYDFDIDVDVKKESITEKIEGARATVEEAVSGLQGVNASEIADAIISGDVTEALEMALESAGVDAESATEVAGQITEAQNTISSAIASLSLSEEASAKIAEMAASGATESELTNYIRSLGVEEGAAQETAATITGAANTVKSAITGMPDGIKTEISGLAFGNDRETLVAALQVLGLNTTDIETVLNSYDTTSGLISAGITGIFSDIETALTDGLPDTKKVIGGLENDVRNWAREAYEKIDEWYATEVEALKAEGRTGEEYDAALLDIEGKAENMRANVQESEVATIDFLNSMAGKSTAYVQQHLDELREIGEEAAEISAEIDSLTSKARTTAEAAFQVVRSGAKADEATISQAIKLKYTEFKVDEQAAEDAYAVAVEKLNADFASGKLERGEFDTAITIREQQLNAAKEEARTAYEQALQEIFGGIAESEGIIQAATDAVNKLDLSAALEELLGTIKEETGIYTGQLGAEFDRMYAEVFNVSPVGFDIGTIRRNLETWAADLIEEASASIENVDSERLQTAYAAALEGGMLTGTVFDTTEPSAQFAAMLGAIATEGAEQATPETEAAGASLVTAAENGAVGSEASGNSLGGDFGDGYVSAIMSRIGQAYAAAYKLARAAVLGNAAGQESASPSKATIRQGRDFGDGYVIGIQESMARAIAVAKRMTGQVVTAAEITRSTRVTIPNLQQEIILANEQSDRSVNLYVNGRQLGRVMAADNQQAQNQYNRSTALGVGK